MGIYGVGRSKAIQWVMQGFRTLQDVLDHGDVTENQRIGIALYDVSLNLNFGVVTYYNRTLCREFQGRKLNNIVRS